MKFSNFFENVSARSRSEIGKRRVLVFFLVLALAFLGMVARGGQFVRPVSFRKLSKSCRMAVDGQRRESRSHLQSPDTLYFPLNDKTNDASLTPAQEPTVQVNPSAAAQGLRAPPLRI